MTQFEIELEQLKERVHRHRAAIDRKAEQHAECMAQREKTVADDARILAEMEALIAKQTAALG